jgi:signal transduction histidine kinase
MRSGMELGADDYITKPFTTQELLVAVQTRLEKHTAMTQLNDEKLEKARQQLTRMVAHELRTPLISINTVLDIISRQLGQLSRYQLQEMLDTIGMGSKRLNRLVDQMVFLTQLETGILKQDEIVSNGVPMRLWEVLITAIDLARRFAYLHPEVDIQLDDRDNLALVMCNPAALKHALAEIITNSLSYSPAGSVATIAQWKTSDSVWISVVDQGQGIPPEHLVQIIEGFHQVDRETHEQQGMGLGLALANRVIEAHGGKLEITSVVGKGTQVLVCLPVWRIG